uniref:Secreted protein n=1 Tax=Callorhinchus milii TaxID=7868 RepID=A0A4W3HC63_CALMI
MQAQCHVGTEFTIWLILILMASAPVDASVTQTPSSIRREECESLTINCVFSASFESKFKSMEFYRRFPNERNWKPIPREGRFVCMFLIRV